MTSLAFGLGVLPLVISNGAGSGGQNAIGTGVLGGVVFATVLGVLFDSGVLRRGSHVVRAPSRVSGAGCARAIKR